MVGFVLWVSEMQTTLIGSGGGLCDEICGYMRYNAVAQDRSQWRGSRTCLCWLAAAILGQGFAGCNTQMLTPFEEDMIPVVAAIPSECAAARFDQVNRAASGLQPEFWAVSSTLIHCQLFLLEEASYVPQYQHLSWSDERNVE